MQFRLRTFLLVAIAFAVILGLWLNALRQRRIERNLTARAGHFSLRSGDFNIEADFSDDQLISLFERYAPRTADESEIGDIAAHAMGNLVIRHHPKGIAYARQYWDTDVSPLWESAVYCLLYHHDLPTYLDYETPEKHIQAGYDANTPLGEFILAAAVHWDFVKAGEHNTLRDNWHDPVLRTAYEDAIGALQHVYPPAANPYARVIAMLHETNGDYPTSPAQEDDEPGIREVATPA